MPREDEPLLSEPQRVTSLMQRLRDLTRDLSRLVELAGHATHPRTRTVTRAGWWALHVVPAMMRWRAQAGEAVLVAREFGERTRESVGVFFGVLDVQSTSQSTVAVAAELAGETSSRSDHSWRPPLAARARIIVNPTSGSVHGLYGLRELRTTAQWLTKRGLPTELTLTTHAGHASELAHECVPAGIEMVIAAGGDGTINDVVQGLAGTAVALGVLPMGTVNVWAREMGISLNLAEARKLLLRGAHRRVDLGRAGSRYFLLMAGVGVDAEIVRRVEGNWMRRWGLRLLDYVLTAGMLGLSQQPARLTYEIGGKRRTTRALMVALGNTRLHAGAFVFAHKAVADDGLLDMVVIGGGGLVHRAHVFMRALLRRPSQEPHARYNRCRTVRLDSTPPLPVQVDGELIGRLPMTFSVLPDALTVIVPPGAPQHLFSRPAITPSRSR